MLAKYAHIMRPKLMIKLIGIKEIESKDKLHRKQVQIESVHSHPFMPRSFAHVQCSKLCDVRVCLIGFIVHHNLVLSLILF